MIPLIVIRPQPSCDATLAEARKLGFTAFGFPLFVVKGVAWDPPDPDQVDALLIGSANALRHGGAALSAFRGKPAYAVGKTTAEAARAAELDVIAVGEGGLQSVLDSVLARHRHLLRLAGKRRTVLEPPEGTSIEERIVYASEPLPMPTELVAMLRQPAVVLLHSAEAARHFAEQCDAHGIDRSGVSLVAIAPRVADAAGEGWESVAVAETPANNAMLALALHMCERPRGSKEESTIIGKEPNGMQEDIPSTAPAREPPQGNATRMVLLVALVAFLLGAGLVGWLAWRDKSLAPERGPASQATDSSDAPQDATIALSPGGSKDPDMAHVSPLGSMETRLALLEDRISRLDLQTNAASGNAARAEGLLIAFAARRMTDKGKPLGYLEDQLKLRFADAQPVAVDTIIAYARQPMTEEELSAQLDLLTPELAEGPVTESPWERFRREVSELFVVHRNPVPAQSAQARVARAKLLLETGKIDEAIAEVASLPGAAAAQEWIANAKRYAEVQRALDLVETAAMLEPRRLKDAEGNKVSQPSPLAQPADKAAEAAPAGN